MSQCHDPYEPLEQQAAETAFHGQTSGTGPTCHDIYPAVGPARSSVFQPGRARHPSAGARGRRVTLIVVKGHMSPEVRRTLWEKMVDRRVPDVIVDLSRAIPDLASTGMLVAFLAQARQRGQRVVVVCPDPVQYKAFLATSFKGAVRIAPTTQDALHWFTPLAV